MKSSFLDVFVVAGKFTILKGLKAAESKFRKELSLLIVNKFGSPTYTTEINTEILIFCQEYYISNFEKICSKEVSYTFYREILWLHEQATSLRHSEEFESLPKGLSKSYIGSYRRLLKLIIEQGCSVHMLKGEKRDQIFQKRIEPILCDLLFLAEMMSVCAESIAEQVMIGDSLEINFDSKGLYLFSRKHHYDFIFQHLGYQHERNKPEYVVDDNGYVDYKQMVKESFDINYDKLLQAIIFIASQFKLDYGDCLSFEKNGFLKDVHNLTEATLESVEKFFSGLSLTKGNKMSLSELLRKPYSLNRYLYRPLLLWNINQKEYYVFGFASWYETQDNLYLNTIPWGKAPSEWDDITSFKNYKNRKEDIHDAWLDDVIERDIKATGLNYQRSLKKLVAKNQTYSLIANGIGEIDFLILSPKTGKIFVAECKHLQGRYDMVNQKNDFDYFTVDGKKKSYNSRLKIKVQWLEENKDMLEEHCRKHFRENELSWSEYKIEGIFFINTPTFYMYNSDFRIFTFNQVVDVITGQHVDPTFSYCIEKDDSTILYSIKYPYFKEPTLIHYEIEDDDLDVDKYGYPIKKI